MGWVTARICDRDKSIGMQVQMIGAQSDANDQVGNDSKKSNASRILRPQERALFNGFGPLITCFTVLTRFSGPGLDIEGL